MSGKLQRIIIPGLIFQGVVIGGGYSTGRELVEFFLSYGVLGALTGLVVVTAFWGVTLAIAFNYAVLTRSFDYNAFLTGLLGRLRYAAEFLFLLMMLLAIAVISDAANNIFISRFGATESTGAFVLGTSVCLGLMLPEVWLKRVISYWSILLYLAYIGMFVAVFMQFGDRVGDALAEGSRESGWFGGAIQYAAYNLTVIPAVLFTLKGLQSTQEARITGALAAVLGIVPAFLFVFAMLAFLPDVLSAPVPLTVVLSGMNAGPAGILFDIVILGTLIQTALGSLNALNDRIGAEFTKRKWLFPQWGRGAIGFTMLVLSIGVGVQFGIINLIARGYGALSIGFLFLLVLPILTIGTWRCIQGQRQSSDGSVASR